MLHVLVARLRLYLPLGKSTKFPRQYPHKVVVKSNISVFFVGNQRSVDLQSDHLSEEGDFRAGNRFSSPSALDWSHEERVYQGDRVVTAASVVSRSCRNMSDTHLTTVILICGIIGAATFVLGSGDHAAENVWRKIRLTGVGALHMLLSEDKKLKVAVSETFPG